MKVSIKGWFVNVGLGSSGRRRFLFGGHFLNNPCYDMNPAERNHYKVHNCFGRKHNVVFNFLIIRASSKIRKGREVFLDYLRGERKHEATQILDAKLKGKRDIWKRQSTHATCRSEKSK